MTHPGDEEQDMDAGNFGSWLLQMQGALRGEHGSDVPCNGCTACCTSSQFVHIGPDETDALAHIPPELLFPAPRLPRGHMLLGYDERGRCPMLIDNRCSIYEHRPVTCRTYDCRVFAASELSVDDDEDKALIARQVRRWRFGFPTQADRDQHDAVRAAAAYLRAHPDVVPGGAVGSTTQLAVLAVEVHAAFLGREHVDDAEIRVEVQRRARG